MLILQHLLRAMTAQRERRGETRGNEREGREFKRQGDGAADERISDSREKPRSMSKHAHGREKARPRSGSADRQEDGAGNPRKAHDAGGKEKPRMIGNGTDDVVSLVMGRQPGLMSHPRLG